MLEVAKMVIFAGGLIAYVVYGGIFLGKLVQWHKYPALASAWYRGHRLGRQLFPMIPVVCLLFALVEAIALFLAVTRR